MANKEKYLRTLIRREIRSLLEATDPAVKKAEIDAATAEVKAAEAKKKAAQDKLKAAQALKEDEILLMNLIEAEGDEEEAAAEDEGGGNPFAAASGDEGGEEAGEEAGGGEEGGEEGGDEKDKETKSSTEKDDLTVTFDVNKVKRYNNQKFRGNTGIVKKITKDGLVVNTQPDNVDILINFDDITESVKNFFKKRK